MSHVLIPKRICSQRYDQVICVLCVFHNLIQNKYFEHVCQFLDAIKEISVKQGKKIPLAYWDKQGIMPQVLEIVFTYMGYKVHQVKGNKNIENGWAIFSIRYNNVNGIHAVAIVRGYLIDSIRIPYQKGVYRWDGSLQGYQYQKLLDLWDIQ